MRKKYYGILQERIKDVQGNTSIKEYVEVVTGKYPLEAKIQLEDIAKYQNRKLMAVHAMK